MTELLETQWGNIVPWDEYPQADLIDGTRPSAFYSTARDRADGRFLPVYETEIDLCRQRAVCRTLAELEGIGKGAAAAMTNYTIGLGMKISVQAAKGQSPDAGLVAEIRQFVTEFAERNRIVGDLDREVDEYSRQDGERLLVLNGKAGDLSIQTIEPEWIVEPGSTRDLEEWLDCDYASSWSFGVHTRVGDAGNPLGYYVSYETGRSDWDYFAADRAEFWKRNVPRTAKRGVSDFLPVFRDVQREAKISAGLSQGAAARAAIAWIEEMAPGVTLSGAGAGSIDAILNRQTSLPGAGQKSVRVKESIPGTVKSVGSGKKFSSMPDGPVTTSSIEVGQYLLRKIGVRWNAPEYLISGDASNANYASSLVAESPFVKGREAEQGWHKSRWVSLFWKAVRFAWEAGYFGSILIWSELRRSIEIQVDFPDVASRDEEKLTNALIAQRDAGFICDRTASQRLGNDYDQEIQGGAKRIVSAGPAPAFGINPQESARSTVGNLLRQEWAAYP